MLYVLRLYEVVLKKYVDDHQDLFDANVDRIQSVLTVINAGYDADLITRHLFEWLNYLNERFDSILT